MALSMEVKKLTTRVAGVLVLGVWLAAAAQSADTLRRDAITDAEVARIREIAKTEALGEILSIGPVLTSCPCGEGAGCSQSLNLLTKRGGRTGFVRLSRIAGQWQLGPLMRRQLALSKAKEALRGVPATTDTRRQGANLAREEQKLAGQLRSCQ